MQVAAALKKIDRLVPQGGQGLIAVGGDQLHRAPGGSSCGQPRGPIAMECGDGPRATAATRLAELADPGSLPVEQLATGGHVV